jgi:lipopolysaccharide assembly protein A
MRFKSILTLLLLLVVAMFSVQNAGVITVRFLHWQFALSQALVILLSALCGLLAGFAAGTLSARRRIRPLEEKNPKADAS